MAKLWDKGFEINAEIERYTVGRDRELDLYLAQDDVVGSMAHITMLESIGLLEKEELVALLAELKKIHAQAVNGDFVIEDGCEDVHSQVELMLTKALGEMGKKIHSGRSRNDQVLVDLRLFTRRQLRLIVEDVLSLFKALQAQSERYKHVLMPGYTHLQIAMPSSFGLWFGAYAESLVDDMMMLQAAYRQTNRNPLGSAAGYGSSFPLNRSMTTQLLGFDSMDYNVVYAQMGRGKTERNVAFAMASVASTVSKMAFDACLFNSQNFAFVHLPKECTTGSSIMPHKKNPDVFELTRAKCNKLQTLPQQIMMIMNNLPSGYFRDLQIIKERRIRRPKLRLSDRELNLRALSLSHKCLSIIKFHLAHIALCKAGSLYSHIDLTLGKISDSHVRLHMCILHWLHPYSLPDTCHRSVPDAMRIYDLLSARLIPEIGLVVNLHCKIVILAFRKKIGNVE